MTTSAKATMVIEVLGLGTWGRECQLEQVYLQAEEAARGRLRRMAEREHETLRIIGDIKITAIMTEDKP